MNTTKQNTIKHVTQYRAQKRLELKDIVDVLSTQEITITQEHRNAPQHK